MRVVSRREFVVRTAGASVALAAAGRAVLDAQGSGGDGMFISLNGSLTRGVGGLDKIKLAAQVGYGGVDWDLGPCKDAGLETSRALFSDLGITPTITGLPMARPLPFGGEMAAFKSALTALADDAAFVAAIGGRRMMLVLSPLGPAPKTEYRKVVVERLAAIDAVLRKAGVRLGLEFLGPLHFRQGRAGGPPPNPFIWTLPETVALAKDAGANVGVILDVWHWHHSGGSAQDILDAGADRIVHVHLSDARAMPPEDVRDNQRVLPGEGVIDITGFLQALHKAGYTGGISPEPLGRIPESLSAEEGARVGLEAVQAAMKRAGVPVRAHG